MGIGRWFLYRQSVFVPTLLLHFVTPFLRIEQAGISTCRPAVRGPRAVHASAVRGVLRRGLRPADPGALRPRGPGAPGLSRIPGCGVNGIDDRMVDSAHMVQVFWTRVRPGDPFGLASLQRREPAWIMRG